MRSELIVLCGLPGSGKSTYAKGYVLKRKNMVVVNRDSIRTMLNGKYSFTPDLEPIIKSISFSMVKKLLEVGLSVIYDETSLTRFQRKKICDVAPKGTDISCLWFTEVKHNIEYRKKNLRGYSIEHWKNLIKEMKGVFEPPDLEIEAYFSSVVKYSTSQTPDGKIVYQSNLLLA